MEGSLNTEARDPGDQFWDFPCQLMWAPGSTPWGYIWEADASNDGGPPCSGKSTPRLAIDAGFPIWRLTPSKCRSDICQTRGIPPPGRLNETRDNTTGCK